jgi:predicted CXXCH cytochrome family protein
VRPALLAALVVLFLPLPARAAGPHDELHCAGCHAAKEVMKGNRTYLDPATGQPYPGVTAVCLACHQTAEAGGKGNTPIPRHLSHPFGVSVVNPRVARVPADFLVNGRIECTSCHDPHPSNTNFKYLRTDTGKTGEKMDKFCAACHERKVDLQLWD